MPRSTSPPRSRDLASLPAGERGSIAGLDVPREVRRQLASLGLFEGVEIRVVRRAPMGGAVLVAVGESQYALGRDVASHILVTTG